MKILIFTAKYIGLNCVNFLLEEFPGDHYDVVVCEPEAAIVIQELKRKGCEGVNLDESVLEKIRRTEERHYDWLLNLWGGYIFKSDVLSRVKNSLNLHPSYLPFCRGRDPVVWALRNGLPAGVTLHSISSEVDEGDIWYRERVHYEFPCTGADLYSAVTDRAWRVFREYWPKIRVNEMVPSPQQTEAEGTTYRRKDLWIDRRIDADSDQAANLIIRRLLAHDFGQGYQAEILIQGKVYTAHLKLEQKQT